MRNHVAKPFFDGSVSNTVKKIVEGAPAELDHLEVSNPAGVDIFLQLFDTAKASDVTLGGTTPNQSYLIPGGSGGRGAFDRVFVRPMLFEKGLSYAATTGPENNVAPASALTLNAGFLPRGAI